MHPSVLESSAPKAPTGRSNVLFICDNKSDEVTAKRGGSFFAFFTPEWRGGRRQEAKVSGRVHSFSSSVKIETHIFAALVGAREVNSPWDAFLNTHHSLCATHTSCADAVQFYHRIHPLQVAPLFSSSPHLNCVPVHWVREYIDCWWLQEGVFIRMRNSITKVQCRTKDGKIASWKRFII